MTDYDPFDNAPDEAQAPPEPSVWDDPPAEPEPAPEPPAPAKKAPAKKAPAKVGTVSVDVKPNLLPVDDGKIVTTFKEGSGYDSSWVVIHANSIQESSDLLNQEFADYLTRVKRVAEFFRGGPTAAAKGNSPQRQQAPRAAQEPPAHAPASPGSGWEYRSGVTKSGPNAGKPWEAWMPPRGSNDKPVFF